MKTRASVLFRTPGTFETVEVDLESPRSRELLVKMTASGLCHSDDHMATGDVPAATFPFCGGHEGSGVVVEVGPDTPGWEIGEHVVFSFVPACGRCRWCAQGKQNLCDLGANMLVGSRFDDVTSFRMTLAGDNVGQMCGVSTFSEYTTVSIESAIKVAQDVPLAPLALLGCGVGTGWGSSVHAAEIRPGDTAIIMGIGGIGMSAVQGAVHAGARDVIAVDPVEFKRKQALEFGATYACADMDEAADYARSRTNGQGADAAIVTVGVTSAVHVSQAMTSIRKAGIVVVTGAGRAEVSDLPINLWEMTMLEKRLVGALYGNSSPRAAVPRLVELYRAGHLKLDEMVTRTYSLDDISEGFEDMHAGRIVRGMVKFDL
ncbi:NDMA-dependent alcohol dehydrogenase [Nocardia flavorosea]|uniref:alcohol dehydrogenase n=1 Tax=Nocardia flavorosea TaxID=53429 RepID=A0A846YSY1_9NOCA|nr:NDMA-dependent alcohol dehydrogenase [Nocardia flavorosea]NKY60584.1 NDMA-dependent alcohol dehydrogenase [Nocardia flavorosea]